MSESAQWEEKEREAHPNKVKPHEIPDKTSPDVIKHRKLQVAPQSSLSFKDLLMLSNPESPDSTY